ncbi:unnamed protein product [Lasius platythorax]|uniref:Uncharacterized protein n=1 Tax=Lasius platythorax TaxID=488582 RepID=A0AAV2NKP0_9HYME
MESVVTFFFGDTSPLTFASRRASSQGAAYVDTCSRVIATDAKRPNLHAVAYLLTCARARTQQTRISSTGNFLSGTETPLRLLFRLAETSGQKRKYGDCVFLQITEMSATVSMVTVVMAALLCELFPLSVIAECRFFVQVRC